MKLSIIIPIYKVEAYLRKCVDSVLNQDLPSSEYEIILVDDGSPDGCPAICDQYAAEHDNLKANTLCLLIRTTILSRMCWVD